MNKIEELRRKKNLTQEQLGKILSVNQTAISKWENGQLPTASKLPEIAAVLGCTIDELFEREAEEVKDERDG